MSIGPRPSDPAHRVALAISAVPLVVFAPLALYRYGFRDDYPILLEAVSQPGKVSRVIASQGRMVYGALLEPAARAAYDIDGLKALRLCTALGLALLAYGLTRVLRRTGWPLPHAAFLAGWLVLLPSAQVLASWSICAPQLLAPLLALLAFNLSEASFRSSSPRWLRALGTAIAIVALAVAALTYQSHALFYVVLVAAALTAPMLEVGPRWMLQHAATLGGGLGLAFGAMRASFALHLFPQHARIRFEPNLAVKLRWFVTDVLPDAMAQNVLDGFPGEPQAPYWVVVFGVGLLVLTGILLEGEQKGRRAALRWLSGLWALSAAAYSVGYLASETAPSYRALYPLAGVWSVFATASVARIAERLALSGRGWRVLPWAALAVAAYLARQNTVELFALPQSRELALMETGVHQILARPGYTRVFVVTAAQNDTSAPHRYRDEFGSVSLDAGWLADVTLRLFLREPGRLDDSADPHYRLASGPLPPAPGSADVLIDLRCMRPTGCPR